MSIIRRYAPLAIRRMSLNELTLRRMALRNIKWLKQSNSPSSEHLDIRIKYLIWENNYLKPTDDTNCGLVWRCSHGNLFFEDSQFLQAMSGIAIDTTWSNETVTALINLAISRLSPELREAFGGDSKVSISTLNDAIGKTEECAQLLLTIDTVNIKKNNNENFKDELKRNTERTRPLSFLIYAKKQTAIKWLGESYWTHSTRNSEFKTFNSKLPIKGHRLLGHIMLSANILQRLKSGDGLWINRSHFFQEDAVNLVVSPLNFLLRQKNSGYVLSNNELADMNMNFPSDIDPLELVQNKKIPEAVKEINASSKLNDVMLKVDLIAGQVNLSLGELQDLVIGHLIALPQLANAKVDLSINGYVIGKGEMIEIDGRLGVEIIQLNHLTNSVLRADENLVSATAQSHES